ncbi:hypothetical protein L1887_59861 [Cichorium endivia]|nr:hypothetical protein L1887_59861 [Cichorium endivia]
MDHAAEFDHAFCNTDLTKHSILGRGSSAAGVEEDLRRFALLLTSVRVLLLLILLLATSRLGWLECRTKDGTTCPLQRKAAVNARWVVAQRQGAGVGRAQSVALHSGRKWRRVLHPPPRTAISARSAHASPLTCPTQDRPHHLGPSPKQHTPYSENARTPIEHARIRDIYKTPGAPSLGKAAQARREPAHLGDLRDLAEGALELGQVACARERIRHRSSARRRDEAVRAGTDDKRLLERVVPSHLDRIARTALGERDDLLRLLRHRRRGRQRHEPLGKARRHGQIVHLARLGHGAAQRQRLVLRLQLRMRKQRRQLQVARHIVRLRLHQLAPPKLDRNAENVLAAQHHQVLDLGRLGLA